MPKPSLHAGKPVIVEKPLAVSAAQAARIAALAARQKLFCMEAFWTFCLPKFDVIRQLLGDGMLGDMQTVLADVGEDLTGTPRVLSQRQAGGALFDLGTYGFGLAHWALGPLDTAAACGQRHPSGVLGQISAVLHDRHDRQAVLHSTILSHTPTTAVLAGSAAMLRIDGPFFHPGRFMIRLRAGQTVIYEEPAIGHQAMFWQVAEAARCITAGMVQSPLRPLADRIATLALMDSTRHIVGDHFPGELPPSPDVEPGRVGSWLTGCNGGGPDRPVPCVVGGPAVICEVMCVDGRPCSAFRMLSGCSLRRPKAAISIGTAPRRGVGWGGTARQVRAERVAVDH